MTMKNYNEWWIDFFKGDFADVVLSINECDKIASFIKEISGVESGANIFDQCCGKGHLASELGKLGFNVTGIDISRDFIDIAKNSFSSPYVRFVHADANEFIADASFDLVVNWHTSFAYNEADDDNLRMLRAFASNLKEGGAFVIGTINPLYVRKNFQKFIVKELPLGDDTIITIRESELDGQMLRSKWTIVYPNGRRERKYGQTKLYSKEELCEFLQRFRLQAEKYYGDIEFSDYNEDCQSLIVYGRKTGHSIKDF